MNTTRWTLLARVRDPRDESAWNRFFDLYAPLLHGYARKHGLDGDAADEIRDQCLEVLTRKMPDFAYDPATGRFKAWLYRLVRGRIIDQHRKRRVRTADTEELIAVADDSPTPAQLWESTWRRGHLRYCLERARLRVPETTYRAFAMLLEEGRSVPDVCAALGLNRNQVYKAKCRVLAAVRELMARLSGDMQ